MSPKTLGDGGRGLGWQHLVNGFVNPYLVKQNLNLFLMFLLSKWYIVFLPSPKPGLGKSFVELAYDFKTLSRYKSGQRDI